jgi:NADP-dependent 3-hydroxy acid dehydrogenase YdfG
VTGTPAATRRAAVTGASRGIGAAIARLLAAHRFEVHAVARPSAELRRLPEHGIHAVHALDIADTAALGAALAAIEPDVLVNNAGYLELARPLHLMDAGEVDRMIDVNLRAAIHAARLVLPAMIRRGRGHIVNIGSPGGDTPLPGLTVYGAAKVALHFLTRSLRYDLAGTGVRVTTVLPGRTATGIHAQASEASPEEVRRQLYEGYRVLQSQDVAEAVLFALEAPPHMDVTVLELMSTEQALGGGRFERPPAAAD